MLAWCTPCGVAPPAGHAAALEVFDDLVLQSFSSLSGLHLEPEQWQQAGRGLAQAGLGLRSTRTHAPAAYLASVGSSSPQCQELDPNYWIDHSGDVAAALCELNAKLSPAQQLTTAGALALSQSELSSRIDATGWASQLEGASAVDKATLLSEAAPGARAFLTCVPSGRTQMEPAVFTAELRVRLRVPESSTDAWCPKCDAILDSHGHHAGMCIAGGERTLRHNALRDLEAGFCRSSHGGASAASVYTDHKKRHLDTAAACKAQHVEFLPLVAETTGAWAPEAAKALDHISRAAGATYGSTLLQEACVLIRTWILDRLPADSGTSLVFAKNAQQASAVVERCKRKALLEAAKGRAERVQVRLDLRALHLGERLDAGGMHRVWSQDPMLPTAAQHVHTDVEDAALLQLAVSPADSGYVFTSVFVGHSSSGRSDSLCAACDVDPADPAGDQEPCPATVLEAKAFFLNRCEELGWKAERCAAEADDLFRLSPVEKPFNAELICVAPRGLAALDAADPERRAERREERNEKDKTKEENNTIDTDITRKEDKTKEMTHIVVNNTVLGDNNRIYLVAGEDNIIGHSGNDVPVTFTSGNWVNFPFQSGNDINVPFNNGNDVNVPFNNGNSVPFNNGNTVDVPVGSGNYVPFNNGNTVDVPVNSGNYIPNKNGNNAYVPVNSGNYVPSKNGNNAYVPVNSGNYVPSKNGNNAYVPVNSGNYVPVNNGNSVNDNSRDSVEVKRKQESSVEGNDNVVDQKSGAVNASTGSLTASSSTNLEKSVEGPPRSLRTSSSQGLPAGAEAGAQPTAPVGAAEGSMPGAAVSPADVPEGLMPWGPEAAGEQPFVPADVPEGVMPWRAESAGVQPAAPADVPEGTGRGRGQD
ncbi:unnamed protein product [Durusdinium trenchii]|uniref:Uncharacterized protein n=1 Tax=Durusdinium trenchii TaxID=1381693 RepID=A0ABP0PPF8_9DINO